MGIESEITSAWQRQAGWLTLLSPLSSAYAGVSRVRRQLYEKGTLDSYRAPVPVMVVGNITVGGSGKTPLLIAVVEHLQAKGIQVAVISRGYGGDSTKMPALVDKDSLPEQMGDEPCMIVQATGVPMAVAPNRKQSIEMLLERYPDTQLIISDDGLQHYKLARDIEWIVVDVARGFGNGALLPQGFLREPIERLNHGTVICHQPAPAWRSKDVLHDITHGQIQQPSDADLTMTLQPDDLKWLGSAIARDIKSRHAQTEREPRELAQLDEELAAQNEAAKGEWQVDNAGDDATLAPPQPGDTVHAVSGIGYPQRFFQTLRDLGYEVIEHPFPDHHAFELTDFAGCDEHPMVMTSKDAIKVQALFADLGQIKQMPQEDESQSGKQQFNSQKPGNQSLAEHEAASKNRYDEHGKLMARMWVLPVTAKLTPDCFSLLQRQLAAVGIE